MTFELSLKNCEKKSVLEQKCVPKKKKKKILSKCHFFVWRPKAEKKWAIYWLKLDSFCKTLSPPHTNIMTN